MTAPTKAPRKRAAAKPAPKGEARIPRPSQGWYRDPETGEKLRRVTTILNQGCAKGEGLLIWAGNITAETAMENLPYLVGASLHPDQYAAAEAWLKGAQHRKKDERKDVGTAVHKLIEAHVLGTAMPDALLHSRELAPFLSHFTAFVRDWQVTFEASEMVVANYQRGYAGTLDYLVRSPVIAQLLGHDADALYMGDTKTGGELDVRGVYPEAALQMAAYRHAPVAWLRDGEKVPIPATQATGIVLHLRPEGYRVIPVICDDAVFEAFLVIQQAADWVSGPSKSVIGSALALPTKPEGIAA